MNTPNQVFSVSLRRAAVNWKGAWIPFVGLLLVSLVLAGCGAKTSTAVAGLVPTVGPTFHDFPDVKFGPHAHIESVRLTLDAFDAIFETKVKQAFQTVEGVDTITTVSEQNLVEVFPQRNVFLHLYDIRSAVNSIRGIKVIRMDIIAAGKLDTFQVRHSETGPDSHPHERYRLVAGDQSDDVLILVEDAKLKELLQSGYQHAIVVGTVSAFEGHVPILKVTDFTKQEVE